MAEITNADLRALSADFKEYVRERTDHVEQRLGDRLDTTNSHLGRLNSKTDKNITDIAVLQRDVHNLSKEVFSRRREDLAAASPEPPPAPEAKAVDLTRGPTWQMVGIGLAAIAGIGIGVWEAMKAIRLVLGILARGQ